MFMLYLFCGPVKHTSKHLHKRKEVKFATTRFLAKNYVCRKLEFIHYDSNR